MLGLALFTGSSALTLAASAVRARSSVAVRSLVSVSAPRDNGPNKEFSVVYTDRALNHMSPPFKSVMKSLAATLTSTYKAESCVIIPGSGTFAMEAVARQFVTSLKGEGRPVVVRNGWFSFRWTEILASMGRTEADHVVLKATPIPKEGVCTLQYKPRSVEDVVAAIRAERPPCVFMPHVETSTGMILPDGYIRTVSAAAAEVGALVVLDCIASGAVWVDMKDLGVDVVVSAPQKGWSGPACAGIVMLSKAAKDRMVNGPASSSYAMDLRKWAGIMDSYIAGNFAYHTTMPTDALRTFNDVAEEAKAIGLDKLRERQLELGRKARAMFESKGLTSVAAPGFTAPGVLVYYSPVGFDNAAMVGAFMTQKMQIAAGVPWKVDEPDGLLTFRIGLFGLDKLSDIDGTVKTLGEAYDGAVASRKK